MRCWIAILVAVLVGGCGGGSQTSPNAAARNDRPLSVDKPQQAVKPSAQNSTAGGFNAPQGAQFTIFCQAIAGPDHVERANRVKETLLAGTTMRDWYVIHQDGQSALYYGYYRSFDDPKDPDTRRAQSDRKIIDAMTDQLGNRPFKYAFFVAMDSPDPVAPPEWNLVNAQGAYSLQIAAYTGSALRKQMAVDSVRDARAAGIPAYYYHGETVSSVCIGAWPESAVRRRTVVINDTGDQEQSVMQSAIPLPEEVARAQRDARNRPIRVEQEKTEILDPTLLKAMRDYPVHAVNGEVVNTTIVDPVTREKITRPSASFVVPIPRATTSILSDPGLPPEPPLQVAPRREQPGLGKLRGVQ